MSFWNNPKPEYYRGRETFMLFSAAYQVGCICPAVANKDYENPACPRKNPSDRNMK